MIGGTEIKSARERAHMTHRELGSAVGVTLRTVGNWERSATVPRNREAAIRSVLADYLDDGEPVPLRSVSDAELLAEIARRFSRPASDIADRRRAESRDTEAPGRAPHSQTQPGAKRRTGTQRDGGKAASTTP